MTSHSMTSLALYTQTPASAWEGGHGRHISPPITLSATFCLPTGEEQEGEPVYGRYGNPSRLGLEATLAALEGARHGLVFSSGMAASCTVLELLEAGDHVLVAQQVYGGTLQMMRELPRRGVQVTFADGLDPEKVVDSLQKNTKLVWLEVCTNPTIFLADIQLIINNIKASILCPSPVVCVDNTFLSPWVVRPLDLGADIVMHSCSKYLNGHNDVVMGALMTNRSLATLEVRMQRHMDNALAVAKFLETAAGVEKVNHPLLPSHDQHELAMKNGGRHSGMVGVYLSGGSEAATKLMSRLTHVMCTEEERLRAKVTPGLVRLSVGNEGVEDIIEDLRQALEA